MKRMLSTLAFLALVIPAQADTTWVAGNVSGEWTVDGSPYMATGDVVVNTGQSLIIGPGVEVNFTGWHEFRIWGSLTAAGSPDSLINFTADPQLNPDGWSGFQISSADTQVFRNCIFERISDEGEGQPNGVMRASVSYIVIENVVVRDLLIDFRPIRVQSGAHLEATNLTLHLDNISHGGCGGIMSISQSSAVLRECSLSGAFALDGGAICLFDGELEMHSCDIRDVGASIWGGIVFVDEGRATFSQCLFAGIEGWDGAVFNCHTNDTVRVDRCTFVGIRPRHETNQLFNASSWNPIRLNSCIFAFVDPSFDVANSSDEAQAEYSCQFDMGEFIDGENNIFVDPLFVLPDSGDFRLTADSPCIDAGDPDLPLDPDGTRADIGAIYYDQTTPVDRVTPQLPQSVELLPSYPNPFNSEVTIRFESPVRQPVRLSVVNLLGQELTVLYDGPVNPGLQAVNWSPETISSGLLFVRLTAGDRQLTQKLVYLR